MVTGGTFAPILENETVKRLLRFLLLLRLFFFFLLKSSIRLLFSREIPAEGEALCTCKEQPV